MERMGCLAIVLLVLSVGCTVRLQLELEDEMDEYDDPDQTFIEGGEPTRPEDPGRTRRVAERVAVDLVRYLDGKITTFCRRVDKDYQGRPCLLLTFSSDGRLMGVGTSCHRCPARSRTCMRLQGLPLEVPERVVVPASGDNKILQLRPEEGR